MFLIGGRFQLLHKIGEGGAGMIFLARDEHADGRPLRVLKFLASQRDERRMHQRFAQEIMLTVELSRKTRHIVQAQPEFGYIPEMGAYYAMEYIEGEELSSWLPKRGRLPVTQALSLFSQLLDVLKVIHDAGVVHRDLKPQNVMVVHSEHALPMLKLTDFGAARKLSGVPLTQTAGALIGTPMYMAPEQFENSHVDRRADIYALGLLLYELLTGEHPFERSILAGGTGDLLFDATVAHLNQAPPRFSALCPGVDFPEKLEALVRWALHKDPQQRLPSVEVFLESLQAINPVAMASPRDVQRKTARIPDLPMEDGQSYSSSEVTDLRRVVSLPAELIDTHVAIAEHRQEHCPEEPARPSGGPLLTFALSGAISFLSLVLMGLLFCG